jgi:hypothetical protein
VQLEVTSRNPEVFLFTKVKGTAYVGGDPVNYADPSGNERCAPDEGCFTVTVTSTTPGSINPLLDFSPLGQYSAIGSSPSLGLAFFFAPQDHVSAAFAILARGKNKLTSLVPKGDCLSDLNKLGVSVDQYNDYAKGLTFKNGTTSTSTVVSGIYGNTSSDVQKQAQGAYGSQTIQDWFSQTGASAVAQILGHNLYVDPENWFDADPMYLGGVLMGELLHQMGFSHATAGSKLGLGSSATHEDLEKRLNLDCFGVKEP